MPVLLPQVRRESDPLDTQSPYWLRLHDVWVQLQGVAPGSQRATERARSTMTSVDGHRYAQQAPRATRDWTLDYRYATPASVALLEHAADAPGEVWLHDDAAARINMVDPAAVRGTGDVVDCGGIPLRTLEQDAVTTIRGLVATTVAMWTTAAAGADVATLTYPGGTATMTAPTGTGPRQVSVAIAAATDGDLVVATTAAAAGLMVLEADPPPMWLAGQRTPCQVSVLDGPRTLLLTPSGRSPRSEYSITLQEVSG